MVVLVKIVDLESYLFEGVPLEVDQRLYLVDEAVVVIVSAKVEVGRYYLCDVAFIPPGQIGQQFSFSQPGPSDEGFLFFFTDFLKKFLGY